MAITRAQQAKQMLQNGGMLVSPSKDGKRPGYRSAKTERSKQGSRADPRDVGFSAAQAADANELHVIASILEIQPREVTT